MTRIKTISHHDQKTSVFECQHHQASNIIHWVIIAATNLQCAILHKLYYLRCRDFLKIVTGHLDAKHNWSKKMGSNNRDNKESNILFCSEDQRVHSFGMIRIRIRDHSDRGRSNEPMNPLWTRIHRFSLSIIIWVISDHRSWPGSSKRKLEHPKCTLKSDLVSKKQQLQKEDDPVREYNSKWRSDHHSNIVIAI